VLGVSAQFDQAISDAKAMQNDPDISAPVTFTGHSLGRGLASAAALETGYNAITFNALGISTKELQNLGLNRVSQDNITAYIMKGEPLNDAQVVAHRMIPSINTAAGMQIFLNPPSSVFDCNS
jgi:hypothetical protein